MITPPKLAAAAAGLACAACATPGIDYVAGFAPGNPDAGQYRTVAVDGFSGPYGDWYEDRFEAMLQDAVFESAPWYSVALFPEQSNVEGVFAGHIQLAPVDTLESFEYDTICVETEINEDEEGEEHEQCVKKKRVEILCVSYTASVAVYPELIDPRDRRLVHADRYVSSRSDRACGETGYVEIFSKEPPKKGGRGKGRGGRRVGYKPGKVYPFRYKGYRHPSYLPDPDYIVDGLFRGALADTIWRVRTDIAPYNKVVRAYFMETPRDLALAADARFKLAIKAAQDKDPQTSCAYWSELAADYPDAPAPTHNLGSCAEAFGDYEAAQTYYAEAVEKLRPFGIDEMEGALGSLTRIATRRRDETVINDLFDAPEPIDAAAAGS